MAEAWGTLAKAAQHRQVGEETIIAGYVSNLPTHRLGRNWCFRLSQVDVWIQTGGAVPKPGEADDAQDL